MKKIEKILKKIVAPKTKKFGKKSFVKKFCIKKSKKRKTRLPPGELIAAAPPQEGRRRAAPWAHLTARGAPRVTPMPRETCGAVAPPREGLCHAAPLAELPSLRRRAALPRCRRPAAPHLPAAGSPRRTVVPLAPGAKARMSLPPARFRSREIGKEKTKRKVRGKK